MLYECLGEVFLFMIVDCLIRQWNYEEIVVHFSVLVEFMMDLHGLDNMEEWKKKAKRSFKNVLGKMKTSECGSDGKFREINLFIKDDTFQEALCNYVRANVVPGNLLTQEEMMFKFPIEKYDKFLFHMIVGEQPGQLRQEEIDTEDNDATATIETAGRAGRAGQPNNNDEHSQSDANRDDQSQSENNSFSIEEQQQHQQEQQQQPQQERIGQFSVNSNEQQQHGQQHYDGQEEKEEHEEEEETNGELGGEL